MNKYKFTGEERIITGGVIVRRINRISDGAIGGWIEAEKNLEHSGDARVEKPLDFIFVAGLRFPVTIRNDGFASIGCQTKTLTEWLEMKFEDQREMRDLNEFVNTQKTLRPIFEFFEAKKGAHKDA